MVAVVAVAVAVILAAKKVLLWTEAVINMLVEELVINVRVGVLAGVEIIVVTGTTIVLEFAVTV